MRRYLSFLVMLFILPGLLLVVGCQKEQPVQPVAEVGKPAPDFTLKDTTGTVWKLSNLKGNLVFVNFWATWCPPCRDEMPSMEALHRRLASEKFLMLSVLYNDDPGQAAQYVHTNGFTFPLLLDPIGEAARAYGITGVPETYIVDQDGILREKIIGPVQWSSAGAITMVGKYLPRG